MAQQDESLGPLTTTFTPQENLNCNRIFVASNPNVPEWLQLGNPADLSACYPSSYNRDIRYYYSPGICPSGFTYNPTTGDPENQVQTAICCPDGFMPKQWSDLRNTANPAICRGRVSTASLATLEFYRYGIADTPITTVTTTTLLFGENIDAWGVIVHRQETDPTWEALGTAANVPEQTTSPENQQSNNEAPESPAATSSRNGQGASPESSSSSGSLGGGVIAAICVGVVLAFVCIAGMVYAAYRIRKSKQKQKTGVDDSRVSDKIFVQPGAPQGLNRVHEKGEYDRRTPELETPRNLVELS